MAFLPTYSRCRAGLLKLHRTVTSYTLLEGKKFVAKKTAVQTKNVQALSPGTSLLAQKMAKQSKEQHLRTSTGAPSEPADSKIFKPRLEHLLVEWDNASSVSSIPYDIDKEMAISSNAIQTYEDAVESIVFPSDVETGTKPSPILGTEDPSIPASDVPCVGCGAPLQCQHNTFPGFLPSEYFKSLTEIEMKTSICQRCYYMRHCNAFVEVSTDPTEYKSIITQIGPTQSAVVLVVDVMDMHGSIISNLMDYIGNSHPLIVVGNKADLLSPDRPEYLSHVTDQLKSTCYNAGLSNIHKVTLASAKTGFGLERLINILFALYRERVDMYIVGTANAGKSSLFNALLASDYCKSSARNLIERATVSVWPGTTLNLLKFPIMRPSYRVVALRHQRLKQEKAQLKLQRQMERDRSRQKDKSLCSWKLKENVNTTDCSKGSANDSQDKEEAWGQTITGYQGKHDGAVEFEDGRQAPKTYDADQYDNSYWAFDTPGVINPEQVFNLLTQEEMKFFTPANMIVPRCLILRPQETVFVSGLSRLDFVKGDDLLMLAVHSGPDIPIHVVATNEADEFYEKYNGSEVLGVPLGGRERRRKLPSLVAKEFEIVGEDPGIAVVDIQLSSVGWISIAPKKGHQGILRAYTPGRKGIYIRSPPLMPNHLQFRGKRIGGTPFYRTKPPGWVMAKAKKLKGWSKPL